MEEAPLALCGFGKKVGRRATPGRDQNSDSSGKVMDDPKSLLETTRMHRVFFTESSGTGSRWTIPEDKINGGKRSDDSQDQAKRRGSVFGKTVAGEETCRCWTILTFLNQSGPPLGWRPRGYSRAPRRARGGPPRPAWPGRTKPVHLWIHTIGGQ